VALVATVAYWGNAITDEWWLDDIERLGEHPRAGGGMAENDIRRTPGLAIFGPAEWLLRPAAERIS
jgi:hypothetical protein